MSYIVKKGRLVGIGRNVKFTLIPSDLKDKRKALFLDFGLIDSIEALDSRQFYDFAKSDPVTFTYALWKLFKEDAALTTERLCDLFIHGNAKEVLRAIELVFFDASKKINAFCLGYIITRINDYIDTNPERVRMAVKSIVFSDPLTAIRVMKGMYHESPKITKEIGKKIMSTSSFKMFKKLISPIT